MAVAHAQGMPGTFSRERHRLQRKPIVSDPGMRHGTCVTHVPWFMSRSPTRAGRINVTGIPSACATRNFTYLVRGPWLILYPYTNDTISSYATNTMPNHHSYRWFENLSGLYPCLDKVRRRLPVYCTMYLLWYFFSNEVKEMIIYLEA